VIIAMLGLPGAGKTTLAKALAALVGADLFLEPDESRWPAFVVHPHTKGAFTSLSWFRSQRVPLYWDAFESHADGRTAILDSYYDKWCVGWLGHPSFEWLIRPDDPYIEVAKHMAAVDAAELPAADAVVVLEIDEPQWRRQLALRSRRIDSDDLFLTSHPTQELFIQTALARAPGDGTVVVRHRRAAIDPATEAEQLLGILRKRGIV
jgi:hypothetical protein